MTAPMTRGRARGSLGLLAVALAVALGVWALWQTLGGADLLAPLTMEAPLRIIIDGETVFDGSGLGPVPPLLAALALLVGVAVILTVVPLALLGVGLLIGLVVLGVIGVPLFAVALLALLLLSPLWALALLLRRLWRGAHPRP